MAGIPQWFLNRKVCPTCGELHRRCGDHTHAGKACNRPTSAGQWRCSGHASKEERAEVVDVESMIKEHRSIGKLFRQCSVTTRGRTYLESLEDALHRANTMVMLLHLLIETIPATSEYTTYLEAEGTPRERTTYEVSQSGMVGPNHEGDLTPHPYLALYREWTTTQGSLAKLAADLGLTERQVEIQEIHVRMMATTMSSILADLGVDVADPRTRKIIETHLLSMETRSVDVSGSLTATATAS